MNLTRAPYTLASLPPTMPLWPGAATPDEPAAGPILGLARSRVYDLAKRGEFPVRLLKIGARYRVARADLLRYLGELPPGDAA